MLSVEGSQMSISFKFPLGANSMEYRMPSVGDDVANVILMTRVGDYASMQPLNDGTVSVTQIEANKTGLSRFEGTFGGKLINKEGVVIGNISDGRFSVDGAVHYQPN